MSQPSETKEQDTETNLQKTDILTQEPGVQAWPLRLPRSRLQEIEEALTPWFYIGVIARALGYDF